MIETSLVADVGNAAPDFALADAAGKDMLLSDLRGQPVLLAFSPRSWDPARADVIAHYRSVANRVPGVDIELLSISDDTESADLTIMLVDAHGIVRWRHAGQADTQASVKALASALTLLAHDGPEPKSFFGASAGSSGKTATWSTLEPSRREFVATALATACLLSIRPATAKAAELENVAAPRATAATLNLHINGRTVALNIEPRVTLLDALREYAGLTGTKKGCDHGQCGACTVHVNGRRQLSCLTFAMLHQGAKITTVEGLASSSGDLHPLQTAFIKHDGFQCGYCTPGQLMSASALLSEPCGKSDADVKECMSGNICRCGAYPGIVAAIQEVRTASRG